MKLPPLTWLLAAALPCAPFAARGQNALYVQDASGQGLLVRDVQDNAPMVVQDGKYRVVLSQRFVLRRTPEYLPVFVSVNNLHAGNSFVTLEGGAAAGAQINQDFVFTADFMSPYALDHVFLVLDLHTEDAGHSLFLQQIGRLAPHRPQYVSVRVPITRHMGSGHYELHVFSDGREVLHSRMPWEYREHVLDQMVQARIAGVDNQPPKPFIGPTPEYPKALRKTKKPGVAVIHFRIGVRGEVLEPSVQSASDPAFGQAALDAIRQWRFLPQVRGGFPVESNVSLPVQFAADAAGS